MKMIRILIVLNALLWALMRFHFRPIVVKNQIFDLWLTESYPSFALVFGYSLISYSFLNRRTRLFFHCSAYTFGGLCYEIVGQGCLDFGTFSYTDVIYTILGGMSAYTVLRIIGRNPNR